MQWNLVQLTPPGAPHYCSLGTSMHPGAGVHILKAGVLSAHRAPTQLEAGGK